MLRANDDDRKSDPKMSEMLGEIFGSFRERVLKLAGSSDGHITGLDIASSLVLLHALLWIVQSQQHSEGAPRSSSDAAQFLVSLLTDVKLILVRRFGEFLLSEVAWIQQCRGDPKKAVVMLPFLKFPAFVDQLKEITGDKVLSKLICY